MTQASSILSQALKGSTECAAGRSANMVQANADGTKAVELSFTTVVSGSSTSASSIVSGVRLIKKNLQSAQGDIYTTQTMPSTYFALTDGPGRACVRAINDDSSPLLYTRRCDFTLQADGTYKNGAGQYLCGILLDDAGNLPAGGINTQNVKVLKIPRVTSKAVPTSEATVNMKLSATAPAATSTSFDATIFDSLGISHNATFTMVKQAAQNTWHLTGVTFTNGGSAVASPVLPLEFVFNTNGAIYSIGTPPGGGPANAAGAGAATVAMTMNFSGNGAGAAQAVTLKFGQFGVVNGMTQNGQTTNSVVYSVLADGSAPTEAVGDEIGPDGMLYTRFAGSSKLTKRAQIVIAVFGNVDELGNANGSTQTSRVEAGDIALQIPGTGNGGKLVPGHLEKSTTDSTQEYVLLLDTVNHQAMLVAGLRHATEADRGLASI